MIQEMSLASAMAELDNVAPRVPILALGQTVFWDEPMKAGIANWLARHGSPRDFVAGVHDTDYFAKVPGGSGKVEGFKALPHNDVSTRELWSAAAEFSALFGSETVVKRETLTAAGLNTRRLEAQHPGTLEALTEAWRWRGIVSVGDDSMVASEVPCRAILADLRRALDWAIDLSLESLSGEPLARGQQVANQLRTLICDHADEFGCCTLTDLYESFLTLLHRLVSGTESPILTTRTSRLLRFNRESCELPRFELLDLFIRPETRAKAVSAYNQAVGGSGLYELDRFGSGAIPFDVYIPKVGRGTIRLGKFGAVFLTPQPQFLTFRKECKSVKDFAEALEEKFGSHCAVVGKAVTLIGMLGREYCFAFHEGASGYVHRTRHMHQILSQELGQPLALHPILRIKYDTWSHLSSVDLELSLPKPLQQPFGKEFISTQEFSERWKEVGQAQVRLLHKLSETNRPLDLLRFLAQQAPSNGATSDPKLPDWAAMALRYEALQNEQSKIQNQIDEFRQIRQGLYQKIKSLKVARQEMERKKGDHFRQYFFEKHATEANQALRHQFERDIEKAIEEKDLAKAELRRASQSQGALTKGEERLDRHRAQREIESIAEEARARLIREAVIASAGLEHSNLRPSAWWFPLLSPGGEWFARTTESAEYYLEPLN